MYIVIFLCSDLFDIDLSWFLHMFKMFYDFLLSDNMVKNVFGNIVERIARINLE